jgi:hypothetical protein
MPKNNYVKDIEASPYQAMIEEWAFTKGYSGTLISKKLKDEFGFTVSAPKINAYLRERRLQINPEIEKKVQEVKQEAIKQGIIDEVSEFAFLKEVVAMATKKVNKRNVNIQHGIKAAQTLIDKDKTTEFKFIIQGVEEYEKLAKALEMVSDDAKREIINAMERLEAETSNESK